MYIIIHEASITITSASTFSFCLNDLHLSSYPWLGQVPQKRIFGNIWCRVLRVKCHQKQSV